MAKSEKPRKAPDLGEKLNWPGEPEGGPTENPDANEPTPRRSRFWRRFGIPWAWGAHHGGTTTW
jgi:hypothetical protein